MTTAEALKAWRLSAGLSQEGAARVAGFALATWRNWEHERTAGPPGDVLRRLESHHAGLLALLDPRRPDSSESGEHPAAPADKPTGTGS
jgi:transcriptional regulator with XRE-family HTH domain